MVYKYYAFLHHIKLLSNMYVEHCLNVYIESVYSFNVS